MYLVNTQRMSSGSTVIPSESSQGTAPSKNGRKRSRNLKVIAAREVAKQAKLPLRFEFGIRQALGDNAVQFNNCCGIVARQEASFQYREWRNIPEHEKQTLREKAADDWDIDLTDKRIRDIIDKQLNEAWKQQKHRFYAWYLQKEMDKLSDADAYAKPHPYCKPEDWKFLVKNWRSKEWQERREKNIKNLRNRKTKTKNGSVTTANHHVRRNRNVAVDNIKSWKELRHDEKTDKWTSDICRDQYAQMMTYKNDSENQLTDLQIMEKVLGPRSAYAPGWSRIQTSRQLGERQFVESSTIHNVNRPSYDELVQQLQQANEKIGTMSSVLENVMARMTAIETSQVTSSSNPPPSSSADILDDRD